MITEKLYLAAGFIQSTLWRGLANFCLLCIVQFSTVSTVQYCTVEYSSWLGRPGGFTAVPVLRENSEKTVPETVWRWNTVYSLQIKHYVHCCDGTWFTVHIMNSVLCEHMEFVECTEETMVRMYRLNNM